VPDNDNVGNVAARYTANLMLDEPPLIARTEAGTDAMRLNLHRIVSPRPRMAPGVFRRLLSVSLRSQRRES
jgi:hypothetical protein